MRDDIAIAYHEAGHAVVAWARGCVVRSVEIAPGFAVTAHGNAGELRFAQKRDAGREVATFESAGGEGRPAGWKRHTGAEVSALGGFWFRDGLSANDPKPTLTRCEGTEYF